MVSQKNYSIWVAFHTYILQYIIDWRATNR